MTARRDPTTTSSPNDLPPAIATYVHQIAVRRRRLALARRTGLAVSVASLLALAACLADRLIKLPGHLRLALLISIGAALILPLLRPLARLVRRINHAATAAWVESRTPIFGQRLSTLVSQYASPPDRRGSPEMLATILAEAEAQILRARPRKLLPWTRAAGPWFLAALTAALLSIAWRAPWLELPRLAARLALPLADNPPVTTTHIGVAPGAVRVIQGESVTIRASVQPTDVPEVTLRTGSSSTPMTRTAPGQYALTIPAVDRPFTYTVSAGDATTPDYAVTALPHPAVADLRVRYVYPDYARRLPLTTPCRDGLLEAPAGTRATLQVTSTEPLRSGALVSPAGRVELRPTPDPRVAEAELTMSADQAYQVELVSDQGVPARGTRRVLVRAVPDRPPAVRLVQPVDDLRIDPHAVLPVWFDALDDIGVATATARVRINAAVTKDLPIPLAGNPRQVDTSYDLDLAPLDLKVGDLVAVSVGVTDGLKQAAWTDERHVLITPRTIDIATYQRISELKQASKVATSLANSLDAASKAAADLSAAGAGPAALPKLSVLNQQLAGAAEAESVLRQALMGALARSDSPDLSTTLANLADSLAVCTSTTARLAARVGIGGSSAIGTRQATDAAMAAARDLQARLAVLSAGQQAAATLADRSNLRTAATLPTTQSTADRVKRTLDRARADVTAAAVSLGMDPNAPDLDARLQQLVQAADALTKGQAPVDYAPAAREWAARLAGPERDEDALAERLDAAAAVESVRPDADPLRAGDLRLAAKAARSTQDAFASAGPATRPVAVEARQQFPQAIAALQAEHTLNRAGPTTRPTADAQAVRDAASEARARLRRYAGETDLLLTAAEAITRQQADPSRLVPPPPVATQPAGDGAAGQVADVGESAAAAIRQVQEMLAAMPADLSRLIQAADASRAAAQRADELRRGAATAPSERQPVARRMADQAESARDGAKASLSSAAKSLDPSAAEALSVRLQHAAPETASAAGAIDARLSPALRLLQQAVASSDPGSLDAAADLTRQAIGRVQEDLRRAQSDLADRNPVAAAKWLPTRQAGIDRLTLTGPGAAPYSAGGGGGLAVPVRGPDPQGYGEALDAYFKGVAKLAAGGDAGGKNE